jgi:two-component sensor histidine kinase
VTTEDNDLQSENARLTRLLVQAGIDAAHGEVVSKLQRALIGELHHRVKNLLAMVLSITSQSIRKAPSLEAANESVQNRIMALARSYDALMEEGHGKASLASILSIAMMPFNHGTRFTKTVPAIEVGPSAAMALSLVMNELCTNATKYGSLSNGNGRVDLTGKLDDAGDTLTLTWRETGGPQVAVPTQEGFGTQVIKVSVPASEVSLDYLPHGLVCLMRIPVTSLA